MRFFFPPKNGGANVVNWKPVKNRASRTVAKPMMRDGVLTFWVHLGAYLKMLPGYPFNRTGLCWMHGTTPRQHALPVPHTCATWMSSCSASTAAAHVAEGCCSIGSWSLL